MGLHASTTCELTFGVGRPAVGTLIGDTHDGIRQMFLIIEHARMMVGTKAIATLSTGYLNALEYAKTRVQGADLATMADKTAPRVTITHHPDVRRMLMMQKAYAEGMRALVLYAAALQDTLQIQTAGGGADQDTVALNDLWASGEAPWFQGFWWWDHYADGTGSGGASSKGDAWTPGPAAQAVLCAWQCE